MAQDQFKKVDETDLVADFRRLAETINFDDPQLANRPRSDADFIPPPLPANLGPANLGPGNLGPSNLAPSVLTSPDQLNNASTTGAPQPRADANFAAHPPALPPPNLPQSALPTSGLPLMEGRGAAGDHSTPPPSGAPEDPNTDDRTDPDRPDRRQAKRRAAMPSRDQIAANDDAPSIGGLIYALNQRPSRKPFSIATMSSIGWSVTTLGFAAFFWGSELLSGAGIAAFLARPEFLTFLATLLGPIGLMFALAVIAYRAEEMRLRSTAMTEVAVRLAEPDRMAEQSVASLGQAVRRQVTFMNDAVTRALGRAGELEAMVHSEVSALERSYSDNERKIRGLIQELASEREALVNTGNSFSGTLRSMSAEVPELIEKLSGQQIKLAKIIEGANVNLNQLESAMAHQTGQLEDAVENRAVRLQTVLGEYTEALSTSLDTRMEQIGTTIASRTGDLQVVFEEYTRALDTTLDNRAYSISQQLDTHSQTMGEQLAQHADQMQTRLSDHANTFIERTQSLDTRLLERTHALDEAFNERLRLFDDAIIRSTSAIDSSISEKTIALTSALDSHAKSLGDTMARQSHELDENLLQGINAVRRTSENITKQSIKALEGLAGQSELLKNVSENLLTQINSITNRFDNQSQQIIRSANALETANYKIDKTLQNRQADLALTLDRLSTKADEFNNVAQGYSRQIEGSLTDAESRARLLTQELVKTTEERSRSAIADIERLSTVAGDTTTRALEDLRSRFSNVSTEMTQGLTSLTSQVSESAGEARRRTAEAADQLAAEQNRMRQQAASLPDTTRESADAMRRVLHDHLRAIDELSTLSRREATGRDVTRPSQAPQPSAHSSGQQPAQPSAQSLVPLPSPQQPRPDTNRSISSLTSVLSQELQSRGRAQAQAQVQANPAPTGAPAAGDSREGWSLGDLLKRASADDDNAMRGLQPQPQQPTAQRSSGLDFTVAARALDPATASAIWQRLGAGQRGIMVRSIYTPEGRMLFDETAMRLRSEAAFAETTNQYLADFERVLQEADRQDPSGNAAQGHLRSDYGRVYLFLAHAAGRIS